MNREIEQSEWENHYRSALLELDHGKLKDRIEKANAEIQSRLRILNSESKDASEYQAIRDALQNLRVLQGEIESSDAPPQPTCSGSHPEVSGEYVVFVDSQRRYLEVTDGVCTLLGYSRNELLGKTIDDITPPELRETVSETFQRYVNAGALSGQYILLARDGKRIPIRYESKVFPDGCLVARWDPLKSAA